MSAVCQTVGGSATLIVIVMTQPDFAIIGSDDVECIVSKKCQTVIRVQHLQTTISLAGNNSIED